MIAGVLLVPTMLQLLSCAPGEVSFPGGKREEGDTDVVHTATREAHEEVWAPARETWLVKPLPGVATWWLSIGECAGWAATRLLSA